MRYKTAIITLASLALAACGSGEDADARTTQSAKTAPDPAADRPANATGFQGTLTLTRDDPYSSNGIVSLDIENGQLSALATGSQPEWSGERLVYLQQCKGNTTASQVVALDSDGFATVMSDCSEYGYKKSYTQPAVSPDGKTAAVFDYEIETGEKTSRFGGIIQRPGIRVFTDASTPPSDIYDVSSPAFSKSGTLYALGFDQNPGVFKIDVARRSAERIDDGRLTGQSESLVIHPDETHALFVNNGHLWEMSLESGKPVRLLVYSHEIAFASYSPDGSSIAFVTREPLREAIDLKSGNRVSIFDRDSVTAISVTFVPSGPISWKP